MPGDNRENLESLDEGDLIRLVKAGSRPALMTLIARLEKPLAGYLRRLVFRSRARQYIYEEAMSRFLAKLHDFDDTLPPWPYLKTIAYNLFADWWKKRKVELNDNPIDMALQITRESPSTSDHHSYELFAQLAECMKRLANESRNVIELHFLCELQLNEIAKIIGKKPGRASQIKSTAIVQLKNCMGVQT